MTLKSDIKKLETLIKQLKTFVHEPRDGRPVVRGVAGKWQIELKTAKRALQALVGLSKGRKQIQKSNPAKKLR
jgi:hypothetical protein